MKQFRRKCFWLAAPVFAGFLLFYIVPFGWTVRYSLVESAFSLRFVGLRNYAETFQNRYFRLALGNTVLFTAFGVPALVVLALLLGVALFRLGEEHARLRSAFVLPILLPSVSVAAVFAHVFEGASPRIPTLLVFLWKNLGFHVVLVIAGLSMIDREIFEAAALDGARGWTKLRRVTIPLLGPTLFFSAVLGASQSLRVYREVYLMYGAYPSSSVYLLQHFMNNHFAKLNYQTLSSAAMAFAAVLFALIALAVRHERRMDTPETFGMDRKRYSRKRGKRHMTRRRVA